MKVPEVKDNKIKRTSIKHLDSLGERLICLDKDLVESFLTEKKQQGCALETLKNYRHALKRLYRYLPEDKLIGYGTIAAWRDSLKEDGYAQNTVNFCISAANSLMRYCGRREFQVTDFVCFENGVQPELTRSEYLRLLQAAKLREKERTYLLVKVFALVGLGVSELPCVTVEAVQKGSINIQQKGSFRIPEVLQRELLAYAARHGIREGAIFITSRGKMLRRSAVTAAVQSLSREACVEDAKCNPRCLCKLCRKTQENIRQDIKMLVDQIYDRLIENEQQTVAWSADRGPAGEICGHVGSRKTSGGTT